MKEQFSIEEIYAKHYNKILKFALKYFQDKEDAKDAIQTVILEILVRSKSNKFTLEYIGGAIRNKFRIKCRNIMIHKRYLSLSPEPILFEQPNYSCKDLTTALNNAMSTIRAKAKKDIFVMTVLEDRPAEEVAKMKCITVQVVRNQVAKMRKELRPKLENFIYDF